MKLRSLLLTLLLAACVPAAEGTDPRGGVIARLVPSAETSGRPFRSSDGWTVTIDKFAVRAGLTAERPVSGNDEYGGYIGGSGRPGILAASEACELRVVAVPVGQAVAYVDLQPRYSDFEKFQDESVCGVEPELLAYFDRRADSVYQPYDEDLPASFHNSPSLVLLAHAEKDGRTFRLELAIDANTYRGRQSSEQQLTTIVANQGVLVRIGVDASALFLNTQDEAVAVSFTRIAAADANGDGLVTGAELGVAKEACAYDDDTVVGPEDDEECDSLLRAIDLNAAYVFGPPQP